MPPEDDTAAPTGAEHVTLYAACRLPTATPRNTSNRQSVTRKQPGFKLRLQASAGLRCCR